MDAATEASLPGIVRVIAGCVAYDGPPWADLSLEQRSSRIKEYLVLKLQEHRAIKLAGLLQARGTSGAISKNVIIGHANRAGIVWPDSKLLPKPSALRLRRAMLRVVNNLVGTDKQFDGAFDNYVKMEGYFKQSVQEFRKKQNS